MPTSTTLSTLNINKLTRAQYDAAVQGGVIGPTDISIITDESFEAVPQYSTMPTASADNVGEVVQYIGASDATYVHGFFYESVSDGESPATYEWTNIQIQPESNNYADLVNKPSINNVVLSGNKTTGDLGIIEDIVQGSNITIDKTDPLNPVISTQGQVNADWNSNSGLSQILNKPTLSTVATTGSYNDLSNKPTIPAAQVNSDWNSNSGVSQILNKPTLATVATSGSYNDLSNKPTIPAAQVNSDWNSSSGVSEILNKPDLSVYALDSDVTTIESYIPSTTSSSNQLADKAFVNSSISNMAANYVTSDAQGDNFATHAALLAGPYYYKGQSYTLTNNDYALVESDEDHSNATTRYMYDGAQWAFQYVVNNAPFTQAQLDAINSTITANKVQGYDSLVSNVQSDWNASSGLAQILNKPSLATVATSGAYSDLSGTPTIPTVNNPTITITQGGVTKGSFSLNQATGDTIALDAGGGGSVTDIVKTAIFGTTTHTTITDWLTAGYYVVCKRNDTYYSLLDANSGAAYNFVTVRRYNDSYAMQFTVSCSLSDTWSSSSAVLTGVVVLTDFYVDSSTGAITCTFNIEPTTKEVHTVIGNTTIAGTWSGSGTSQVFTPTTSSDILSNANGFLIKVA